jgi:membrane-associated phospholipid phosphatase
MYGGATAVGLSRMYDDQHWASDVLMGAAIGTFAGLKTVRFNHTHVGNELDRILLGARIVSTGNGTALAWSGTF